MTAIRRLADIDPTTFKFVVKDSEKGGKNVFINDADGKSVNTFFGAWDAPSLTSADPAVRAAAEAKLAHVSSYFHKDDLKKDSNEQTPYKSIFVSVSEQELQWVQGLMEHYVQFVLNNQNKFWPKLGDDKKKWLSEGVIRDRITNLVKDVDRRQVAVNAFFPHAKEPTKCTMLNDKGQLMAGALLQNFQVGHPINIVFQLGGLSVVGDKIHPTLRATHINGAVYHNKVTQADIVNFLGMDIVQPDAATAAQMAADAAAAAAATIAQDTAMDGNPHDDGYYGNALM
jgi:hypothetical protein